MISFVGLGSSFWVQVLLVPAFGLASSRSCLFGFCVRMFVVCICAFITCSCFHRILVTRVCTHTGDRLRPSVLRCFRDRARIRVHVAVDRVIRRPFFMFLSARCIWGFTGEGLNNVQLKTTCLTRRSLQSYVSYIVFQISAILARVLSFGKLFLRDFASNHILLQHCFHNGTHLCRRWP